MTVPGFSDIVFEKINLPPNGLLANKEESQSVCDM
jgi:hypothetical protein